MAADLITFTPGKIVCGRWKVISRLGAGGCGSVYKVQDMTRKGYMAALKAEAFKEDDEGVLKLEANVLRKLSDRKHVVRLVDGGKRATYSFIVMTICGSDLMSLKRKCPNKIFSDSTILRIAVHSLYAIKQLHEIGYVHRDVKPGNMMSGGSGRDARVIFMIDYGMARLFVVNPGDKTKQSIRKPRKHVFLRGTLRYCSIAVHHRAEQGRVDDLWAMLYMCGELLVGLPWNTIKVEKDIVKEKEETDDGEVFRDCPQAFVEIAKYLRTLRYQDRPDYNMIYEQIMNSMRQGKYSFLDPYDWELGEPKSTRIAEQTAVDYSEREKATYKALPKEELEFLIFPTVHPRNFRENVLNL